MANSGGLYTWSRTPDANASADNTVNWAEGQPPSTVNDSARSMMASAAKYRDDIAGALVTGGTSTAYTVSSYQNFDSAADASGQMIAFSPHATNGAGPVTISVDGLGAKPLRTAPNTEMLAGVIIQGTPYSATYNNADGAWYLQGYFGSPLSIPLFGGIDYWDTITPNSNFIFPTGQAISRTTYPAAFARWGTTFGAGDGSTTFNVPNKVGRVSAMLGGGPLSGATMNFLTLGGTGGAENHALGSGEIPTIYSVNNESPSYNLINGQTGSVDVGNPIENTPGGSFSFYAVGSPNVVGVTGYITISAGTLSSVSTNTGGGAHTNVQPTILCNYIIRII